MRTTQAKPFGLDTRSSRVPRDSVVEHDPTCPACKGGGVAWDGFDCVRCAGEGVVDE